MQILSASKGGNPLATVPDKAQVEIVEEDGEWYKAKVNEQTGYLFAEFVNKTETTENHQNQQRNRLQQNKQQKKKSRTNQNSK